MNEAREGSLTNLIRAMVDSSVKNLLNSQSDILKFTNETSPTEWNLSHHFANELKKYLFWLDHDLDVTKRNYDNKRPDIIFHKRGCNALNFLVVEMKRKEHDKASDINKIQRDWMDEPLAYSYGAYVNIWAPNDFTAVVFSRHGLAPELTPDNTVYLRPPNVSNRVLLEFRDLVAEVLKIGQQGGSNTTEATHRLETTIASYYSA